MVKYDKIPKRPKYDKKTVAIIVLSLIILIFVGNMLYANYQQYQQDIFLQGVQRGQLEEQSKAITQLQSQGFYEIVVFDETENKQIPVRLIVENK
jgi:uncharacterized protein YxeA